MDSSHYTINEQGDVLYVRAPDVDIWASRPVEGDDFVILNMDRDGRVVGLQIVEVSEMSASRWSDYFHTSEIPEPIFAEVYSWLAGTRSGGYSSSSQLQSRPSSSPA